jgi:MYXO-CTERM domain-containing protein
MHKSFGRFGSPRSASIAVATSLLVAELWACGSEDASPGQQPTGDTGQARPALSVAESAAQLAPPAAPTTLAFELELDGERFELALQRTTPPTTANYQGFRRTREGVLIPLPPPALDCTFRGVTTSSASAAGSGFAAMNVCTAATGLEAGQAASGILRAGGRFWQLTPDPLDSNASDGVDHLAQLLRRSDTPGAAPEPVRRTTLYRLPESPAPRLEFLEGTDLETKYIDLIVVNDAARVADIGGGTEATTIQFVDTMNALLDGSGLSPRLRVTLRAQVLFDQDPYENALELVDGEVDNDSLLGEFLDWGNEEDLPAHDEHMLLSGLDFVGGVVGYAGLNVACSTNSNGFIVQAGDASGGFAVLSAVHELGHTLGMDHDGSRQDCPQRGFIMAAVGCGNCPGAEQAEFSPCSIEQFQAFLSGPAYEGVRCADDVPQGGVPSCGDGAVQQGESCDCGSNDCTDIDPCCNGATCQLDDGAECSDFNDGCCESCTIVGAEAGVVCRSQRSSCDIAEVCNGNRGCPADSFEPAGETCEDERGNAGACYFGDCRSRGTQCEQIAEQQNSAQLDGLGAPPARCGAPCSQNQILCGNGNNCVTINGPGVIDGVPCEDGQCVDGQCVSVVDQCPNDPTKDEPGDCGCGSPDSDRDADGTADCSDGCPEDSDKQAPGACGCGEPDIDSDRDAVVDCNDDCPSDARKSAPGDCGCGNADTDADGDGAADCIDECPADPSQRLAGACGCGVAEVDGDFDGTPDCVDRCSTDPASITPPCTLVGGTDTDGDGDVDVSAGRKSDGGCAIAQPGAAPGKAPHPAMLFGWLALAAVPLLRRRHRSR